MTERNNGEVTQGDVEAAVVAELDRLDSLHPMADSLSAMAVSLAKKLDNDPGMLQAALNRELRETIETLVGESEDGDERLAAFLSELST